MTPTTRDCVLKIAPATPGGVQQYVRSIGRDRSVVATSQQDKARTFTRKQATLQVMGLPLAIRDRLSIERTPCAG